MNQLACILMDFDGTLVDSVPLMKSTLISFLNAYQLPVEKCNFSQVNGPPLPQVINIIKEIYQLDVATHKLLQHYEDLIDEQYAHAKLLAGSETLLMAAKKNDVRVCIVTSNQKHRVSTWLKTWKLDALVDGIVSSDDIQFGKPHPEPYLVGLRLMNASPSNTIAIEDSLIGAASALAAELPTYCLLNDTSVQGQQDRQFDKIKWIKHLGEIINPPPA